MKLLVKIETAMPLDWEPLRPTAWCGPAAEARENGTIPAAAGLGCVDARAGARDQLLEAADHGLAGESPPRHRQVGGGGAVEAPEPADSVGAEALGP